MVISLRQSLSPQLVAFPSDCLILPSSFLIVNIVVHKQKYKTAKIETFTLERPMVALIYTQNETHSRSSNQASISFENNLVPRVFSRFKMACSAILNLEKTLGTRLVRELGKEDKTVMLASVLDNGYFYFRCEMA